MINIFKIIGIIGLILMSSGILIKKRRIQDLYFISGGVFLEIYSIYIGDLIFIILQIVFVLVVIYDRIKIQFSKK